MKRAHLITLLLLVLGLGFTLALVARGAQQLVVGIGSAANDGTGDTLRSAFGKVNTNFSSLFPTRFATNASYALDTNFLIHAWTAKAVVGTNTLPPAAGGSPTNILRLILKDEGGNATATNIAYLVTTGDRIDGATSIWITNNYGTRRLYSAGGTNWYTW